MDNEPDITTIRVHKDTVKKVNKLVARLQGKTGESVTQEEAVAVAVEKCLAEVA